MRQINPVFVHVTLPGFLNSFQPGRGGPVERGTARPIARSLLSGGPNEALGGLWVRLGNRRAARHNSILGKLVGPNLWAPRLLLVSLQCSSAVHACSTLNTFSLSLFFSPFIGEIRGSTSTVPLKPESSSSPNHATPSCGETKKCSFRQPSRAASL